MPKDNSDQAKDLADKYLKLIADQKTLQSQLDELKKTIGKFSQENNIKELKSGNTLLKVSQGERTVFPKVEEKGRNEVMKIMYASQEYKYSVTFDIVKLGLAYDTNQLSQDLKDKLKPFIKTEPFIRVTASQINYDQS
ncbi:MAG: hypothetical protein U0946_02015 [Patescibacteria group bacterium]|nr:hypothetical protein [Patescibacteria group bacterium]